MPTRVMHVVDHKGQSTSIPSEYPSSGPRRSLLRRNIPGGRDKREADPQSKRVLDSAVTE